MKKFSFVRSLLMILLALALVMSMVCFAGCDRDKDDDDDDDDDDRKTSSKVDADDDRDDFIDGIGGVSDTFAGAVSEDSYSTPEDAAVAFVENEVVGEKNAEIVNLVSKGDLSNSEVDDLEIPEEMAEGIQSVELIEVEYDISDYSVNASNVENLAKASTTSKTYKVKVYVIKYTVDWKYFVPMPVTGDTISKSYYDSVFDSSKYANCTFENTSIVTAEVDAKAEGQKQKMTMKIEMYQIVKYADNKVYFEQRTTSTQEGTGMETTTEESVLYAYMEEVDGRFVTYVKNGVDGYWTEGDLVMVGVSNMKELRPFYNQYLDYTYFTKEAYGFKLGQESAREYMRQALSATAGLGNLIDIDTMDIDMYAEYYVNEGALSGMRMDAVIGMDMEQQGVKMVIDERVETIAKCTDYGTTVVENPMK